MDEKTRALYRARYHAAAKRTNDRMMEEIKGQNLGFELLRRLGATCNLEAEGGDTVKAAAAATILDAGFLSEAAGRAFLKTIGLELRQGPIGGWFLAALEF